MKKIALLIIAMFLVLGAILSGCTPATKVYVCADGREVASLDMCSQKTVKETNTDALPEPIKNPEPVPVFFKDLTPEALELFDKAEKASTIHFNYFRSDNPYTQNTYAASRQLLKVELDKSTYSADESFDVVYLNLSDKTMATGYCELASKETCPDRNRKYEADFEKYHITTPYEWLDLVSEADLTGRSKQIDSRQAKEITFRTAEGEGTMWLDSFFGLPLEVNYNGVDYKFQNAVINNVKESTLVHQRI
jgi:hypothetical protein